MTQEVGSGSQSDSEPSAEKAGGKVQKYPAGCYLQSPNKPILHAGVLSSSDEEVFLELENTFSILRQAHGLSLSNNVSLGPSRHLPHPWF